MNLEIRFVYGLLESWNGNGLREVAGKCRTLCPAARMGGRARGDVDRGVGRG